MELPCKPIPCKPMQVLRRPHPCMRQTFADLQCGDDATFTVVLEEKASRVRAEGLSPQGE